MDEKSKHTAMPEKTRPDSKLMGFIDKHYRSEKRRIKVLDFGAGHGRHANALRGLGYTVYAYDPFNGKGDADPYTEISNKLPPQGEKFDLVFSAYVLNVMGKEDLLATVAEAEHYAEGGLVVHTVREDSDMKKKVAPGESFKGKKGSIQRWVPIDELENLGYHRMENKFFVKEF